jgi:raffinose/stachyose/melibiose transport system substrate-binding protein
MKKKLVSLGLAVIMLCSTIVLAGCTKSAGTPNGENGTKDEANNNKGVEQVFEISHVATEANQITTLEGLFNGFVEEYNTANGTNYKLKLTPSQSKDIINTRMSSKDKPDIFLLDSPADVAQYVKDDLLLDLTSYAEKSAWNDTLFDWAYNLSKVNNKVYTLPYGYEGIVIWYNKEIMAELGLDAASMDTREEFENALALAKEKGYTPIMLGAQDWPWAQEWYLSILMSYTGRGLLKDVLEGKNDASWTDDRFTQTINMYKEWHDKGYLADGKSYVLTSDDAINAFTNGKALFKLEGTWAPYWIVPLDKEVKDKIGVMLHPAINDTEKPHVPIAVGGMWCVSKDTKSPELAAFILEKLLSQDIQSSFLETGLDVAPIAIDAAEYDVVDPVVKDMWLMLNDALDKGDYGYTTYAFYPPETRVYIYEGIVNVLEGNTTVKEYLEKVQTLTNKEREAGFLPILP